MVTTSAVVEYIDRALSPVSKATRSVFDRYGTYFEWWFRMIDRIEGAIWKVSKAVLALLVTLVTFQVITRYTINWVPYWGGELSRYLAIWASLLMMSALVWQDRHLQVEFVFEKLPLQMRRRIRSLQLVIIGVFAYNLTYYGWEYAISSGFRSTSTTLHYLFRYLPIISTDWRLDIFWVYIILPISGVLLMVTVFSKLIQINYYPEQLEVDYSDRYGAVEIDKETDDEGGD